MRVATFNLHAGVDGWGRPTRAIDLLKGLDADLLIAPELWRGDGGGEDLYDELASATGTLGAFAPLAHGERTRHGVGGRGWQPLTAHLWGERGLYFDEHRPLTKAQHAHRERHGQLESGTWGLGLLTRLPIEEVRVVELGRLPREKVRRAIIVARLRDGEHAFHVLALHGSHISHGSHRLYRRVNEIAAGLEPSLPVLLGGDFNCWRPLLRVLLPGWRSLAKGRTWPARHPHSQIDHLLGRGPWRTTASFTRDGGSDHLALVADLELG